MRILSILGLLLVLGWPASLGAQESDKAKLESWKVSAEEAARENSVEPDEESLEEGKVLFDSQCAMCHGKAGDGKGDLAPVLGSKVPDMTLPEALRGISDGALFARITKGKGDCPDQQDRLPDPIKWKLVNHIRKMTSTEPAQTKSAERGKTESAAPSASADPER
ncbi:MAG: hypothetical protein A3H27_06360 [Acidobacteria bacterium RIFCSPLOWO2_02_FULL_59_13]|nr:MAG: hypothetical protein A3H27_06360 [Acidobacteria bacterium RIFCSPLOWO2_02_FULL_59_13]